MARTVLLADDSVTAQNMGRRILIDAGYDVITVNNGSAALKKVHENRPDLIVLDVYMPGYGGLEVCQRLKEADETSRIPILLTVGKMEPFKTEEAKRARADAHIIKPFEASELLAALTKLEDRIVPHSEPVRSRKSKPEKPEKKSKAPRAFDPAMSFDDTQSDKIAYLEQVKQRAANDRSQEQDVEAEDLSAEALGIQDSRKKKRAAESDGPNMPRPMGVYAADALREMPVIAEPVTATEDSDTQQQPASAEGTVSGQALSSTPSNADQNDQHKPSGESADPSQQKTTEIQVAEPSSDSPQIEMQAAPPEAELDKSSQAETAEAIAEPVPAAAVPIRGEDEPAQPESAVEGQDAATSSQPVAAVSRWVAENVPLTPEEASLELEREMNQMQSAAAAMAKVEDAGAEFTSTSPEPNVAVATAVAHAGEDADANTATFAAAASASASAISTAAPREGDSETAASPETAAAWENWRHIRESVMGSQTAVSLSETITEAAVSAVQEMVHEPVASSEPGIGPQDQPQEVAIAHDVDQGKEAKAADDSDEAAVLSSIVDSVLAELKPKLMQEIAKKLKK